MRLFKLLLILIIPCLFYTACKVSYSFTGGTLSPEVKTFSVQYFPNRASLVNPDLSNKLTEDLKEIFRKQTSLDEITNGGVGHLNFEGEITGYNVQAMDIKAGEIAATNRLTITIKVRFSNEIEPEYDFDKSFSDFYEYDSSNQLSDIEETAVADILERIIDKIYNESVVNW
ncbi:MAG: LPS assembly lipoprotein LptE [Marinifilaceae bacterium]|jgi:hypothetical protein|nr:LPS assembly lipoprotein LptE [Marinifilaceae bacterium]